MHPKFPKWKMWTVFYVLLSASHCTAVVENCPAYCKCDVIHQHNRANCSANNLQNANIMLPETVQILDLSYNNINVIHSSCFENYSYLSHLSLAHNELHTIHREAFSMLRRVRFIDLSFNQLVDLDQYLIETNSLLHDLNLEGNKFMLQCQRRLLRSKFLRSLNLRNSQLYCLEELMFAGLPELQEVDLSENYFIKINIAAFTVLTNLRLVDITANQWMQNDLNSLEGINRSRKPNSYITLRVWSIDYTKGNQLAKENNEMFIVIRRNGSQELNQQWYELKLLTEYEDNNEKGIKSYDYDNNTNNQSSEKYIHYSTVSPRCRSACGLSFFSLREACDQKLSNLRVYLEKKFLNVSVVKEKNDSSSRGIYSIYGFFAWGLFFGISITMWLLCVVRTKSIRFLTLACARNYVQSI